MITLPRADSPEAATRCRRACAPFESAQDVNHRFIYDLCGLGVVRWHPEPRADGILGVMTDYRVVDYWENSPLRA